jgi:hypothetical protein
MILTHVVSDDEVTHTVMYIWACLCTELYSDYYKMGITDENYFGRLDLTMFSKLFVSCLVVTLASAHRRPAPCILLFA